MRAINARPLHVGDLTVVVVYSNQGSISGASSPSSGDQKWE